MTKVFLRKLGRIGKKSAPSLYVTIPKELIQELAWADGWQVTIKRAGKQRRLVLEAHEPWLVKVAKR